MSVIRLTDSVIDQIAAGEVVERPASIVKELVENAIDAGAQRVEIITGGGGKELIRVIDDGKGMSARDLELAVERHCTSKLSDDLLDIRTLGFRGEALPSIGSVSALTITTRPANSDEAWQISVTHARKRERVPAALSLGTVVEVRDLFQRVPARLKFLKSERAEASAITDIVKRMALAFPKVHFQLSGNDRQTLDFPAASGPERIRQVLGREFHDNAIDLDAERENIRLTGRIGLPTFNRGNALNQFFFVNGRPVRDKLLLGAVRGAYADSLPSGRHPVLALYLELPAGEVDVNVHPAKADVRFRDGALVRGLLVGAIRQALAREGIATGISGRANLQSAFRAEPTAQAHASAAAYAHTGMGGGQTAAAGYAGFSEPIAGFERMGRDAGPGKQADFDVAAPSGFAFGANASTADDTSRDAAVPERYPLGAARAQLHKNYIVSQTGDGLIIVDQHAAHERIVYEALKKGMEGQLASQMLLIPEIIDLPEDDVDRLDAHRDVFSKLGLEIEKFGPGAIAVRATPAMLGEADVSGLIRDLADELAEWGTGDTLTKRLFYIAATMACHGSVRSGRILKPDEMNALLRQMEATPNAGTCNHGRPTFISLDLKSIERLFGR